MLKKLLLTSVALLSIANVAFGYDIYDVQNSTNVSVHYGATKVANISDGTFETDTVFQNVTFDPDNYEVVFTQIITNTYTGLTRAYELTPLWFDGTDVSLSNWNIDGIAGKETPVSFLEETTSFVEDGKVTNKKLYDQYCKLITEAATQIAKKAGSGKGSTGYVYKGDELLAQGIDEEDDGSEIDPLLYYACAKNSKKQFTTICQIYSLDASITIKDVYENGKTSYQVKSIPSGFLSSNAYSLTIPFSVTNIADDAFVNASGLRTITSATGLYPAETYGDNTYLFKEEDGKRTLIFATRTASNVKAHSIDLEDNVTKIDANALKYHYNLTMYSTKIAGWAKADANGNIVVNTNSGANIVDDGTVKTAYGNAKYLKVSGNIDQAEFAKVVSQTWGYQYVEFVSGVNIKENLDLEKAISSLNTKNKTSWKSADHNTIYFFANTNDHTISGKNMVDGTAGGTCANFVLDEVEDQFYNPYKFKAIKAKLNRSIGGNYSTVAFPFAVTGGLANDFRFCQLADYNENTNVFTFAVGQTIGAYVPNIIKSINGNSTPLPTFSGVDIEETGETLISTKTAVVNATFVAAMGTSTLSDNGDTYYYGFSSNQVMKANNVKIKTFRAYLTGPADSYNNNKAAASLRVVDFGGNELEYIEGEATGLDNIINNDTENTIYNLNGERIENIKNNGIYVVNGKKVIIK